MRLIPRLTTGALILTALSFSASAKEVTVMISGGFKAALEKLAPEYERQTGDNIVLIPGRLWERLRRQFLTGLRAGKSRRGDHGGRCAGNT